MKYQKSNLLKPNENNKGEDSDNFLKNESDKVLLNKEYDELINSTSIDKKLIGNNFFSFNILILNLVLICFIIFFSLILVVYLWAFINS